MNAGTLIGLGFMLAAAVASAACGSESSDPLIRARDLGTGDDQVSGSRDAGAGVGTTTTPEPGKLPTGSKAGETFFASDVFPFLKTNCAGCHAAGGSGNPTWIDGSDAKKTYDMLYLQAYATATSRIVVKGLHGAGNSAQPLTMPEKKKWADWIALESKEPGKPAQASVLQKFGDCFDKALFDAIEFKTLRVTRRTENNNPQGLVEDEDKCNGCKENTPCNRCHSGDDVTGSHVRGDEEAQPAVHPAVRGHHADGRADLQRRREDEVDSHHREGARVQPPDVQGHADDGGRHQGLRRRRDHEAAGRHLREVSSSVGQIGRDRSGTMSAVCILQKEARHARMGHRTVQFGYGCSGAR
jgi:hypothetical protein